jgi:hypothetical protein
LDASDCNLENTFRFYFRDNLGSGRNAGKKRNEEGSSHVSLEAGYKPTIDPSHNQRKTAARLAIRVSMLFLGIITTTKIELYSTILSGQRRIIFFKVLCDSFPFRRFRE